MKIKVMKISLNTRRYLYGMAIFIIVIIIALTLRYIYAINQYTITYHNTSMNGRSFYEQDSIAIIGSHGQFYYYPQIYLYRDKSYRISGYQPLIYYSNHMYKIPFIADGRLKSWRNLKYLLEECQRQKLFDILSDPLKIEITNSTVDQYFDVAPTAERLGTSHLEALYQWLEVHYP